jgi:hypothetical protein
LSRSSFLAFPSPSKKTHGLGLLVENGLGLTSVTGLLSVISPLSLGHQRVFTLLVLGDLVRLVLPALLALAVGPSGLGTVERVSGDYEWGQYEFDGDSVLSA